ncbi:hypothetical protein FB390_6496 [Nocardia bhagyanarayanae]|uniref:Serine/threonine-protein kinase RsbW n=2 Tax=Nocardia bhagyanarayanae TaxID=1215925 RepID=A0A543EXK8_9NOCA|nr:hypothetical protein FB390_6496 [Nocardia bhagyanarayanae]
MGTPLAMTITPQSRKAVSTMTSTQALRPATETVSVRVPARPIGLTMLRTTVESTAVVAYSDADGAAELGLIVEEVARGLVDSATDDSMLDCTLSCADDMARVRLSATTRSELHRDRYAVGWQIVDALTKDTRVTRSHFDHARHGYPTEVDFDWQPRVSAA